MCHGLLRAAMLRVSMAQPNPKLQIRRIMGTRHSKFGIVINPEIEEKVEWTEYDEEMLLKKLRELKFMNKEKLEKALQNVNIEGQPRKKAKSSESEQVRYNVKIVDYGGQLERGEGGAPHWQMWVETKPQTTKLLLLRALSLAIYGKEKSNAISVQILGVKDEDLKNYCLKEGRLELGEEFSNNVLDKQSRDFQIYLERNPSLKKYMTARGLINDSFLNF